MGQKLFLWFSGQPSFHKILHPRRQGPSTYEAILSDHPEQSTVLMSCGLPRSHRGLAWHQSFSGSMPPEDAVDGGTSQTHVTSNSALPQALTGKCKHFMPDPYRDWMEHYWNNQWELRKICNCLFELATVRRQIWGNDHLRWSFGLRRFHSALKCKTCWVKVRFRWGAVTGTFQVNFSPLEAQNFHIDFIASNGVQQH